MSVFSSRRSAPRTTPVVMRVHRSLFSLLQAHFPPSAAAHIGWAMIRAADAANPKHGAAVASLQRDASDEDIVTIRDVARRCAMSPRATEVPGWDAMSDRIVDWLEAERERRLTPAQRAAASELADRRYARFTELNAAGVPDAAEQALREIPVG